MTAALEGLSGLDDAGRLDAIRALEQLGCVASAAQAQLAAELDESQRSVQAEAGVPAGRRGRGVAEQVAWARRESPHRGRRHLGLARIVARELPATWRAWRSGHITEWKATLIARETACLSLVDRLRVDSAVADGVGVHARLTRAAASARAGGDERSKGQAMADALVGAVLGSPDGAETTSGPPVSLGLVMTDTALFGTDEEPAHIDGFGPIPAELARELVVGACSRDEQVWLRRLYTSSTTGQLVAMDSRQRLFKDSLARFIRLRDQVCRTAWCDAPIRRGDHADAYADGGPTSAHNGQGLCEACDLAKQAPGWRARPSPGPDGGHEVETTLPTGHTYRSRAPALATLRRTPVTIDYVLAG